MFEEIYLNDYFFCGLCSEKKQESLCFLRNQEVGLRASLKHLRISSSGCSGKDMHIKQTRNAKLLVGVKL